MNREPLNLVNGKIITLNGSFPIVENLTIKMTVAIDSAKLATDLVKVTSLNAPYSSQRIATE